MCSSDLNEAVRNNAIDAFCATLQAHHQHFGDGLWREIFGLVLLPVAITFVMHALRQYYVRARAIRRREPGPYEDKNVPVALAIVLSPPPVALTAFAYVFTTGYTYFAGAAFALGCLNVCVSFVEPSGVALYRLGMHAP